MTTTSTAATEVDSGTPLDGRVARRRRNQDAVLDVVLELFAEDMVFPTIEQASKRSGLSLRSLYRYFADPGELVEAAIRRSRDQAVDIVRLAHIGEGPFEERLRDFVGVRIRLHDVNGPMFRATVYNAATNPRVRDELDHNRRLLREQFERQFAPELAVMTVAMRSSALEVGNLLTQIDSIDQLRRYRNLTVAETDTVLRHGLTTILTIDS